MSKIQYRSKFRPSDFVTDRILKGGKIITADETPASMVERIIETIYETELGFVDSSQATLFAEKLGLLMDTNKVVFSTPVMTNAGREDFSRPLSACVVPPISLNRDLREVRSMVDTYHREAMGTGFNFDDVEDPVATLLFLNEVAVSGSKNGEEDRPVGNMGILTVDHPRIVEFIEAKRRRRDVDWKFNISISTPESFWIAAEENLDWKLKNGATISANYLLNLISISAYECADPGVIFMDRLNRDNPIPEMGQYTSVAPCAEVGLLPGETCQFGYINLGAFVVNSEISIDPLGEAVDVMTRALDDCLEVSMKNYTFNFSRNVVSNRRKIGVGICGLADMLIALRIPYDSEKGRTLCRDIVAYINYRSKLTSHNLAFERGSFGAMNSFIGNSYYETPNFLERKYGNLDTEWVKMDDWLKLGQKIKSTKKMRNCSTIALPPTGRSALVIDASTGVEPIFTLFDHNGSFTQTVRQLLGDACTAEIEQSVRNGEKLSNWFDAEICQLLKTSIDIAPKDHVLMIAALQPVVDESISKTVNLPHNALLGDIEEIYRLAYKLNLKGMTMYRDGIHQNQPKGL